MEQRFEVMLEPLRAFLAQVGDFLPRLAVALVVGFNLLGLTYVTELLSKVLLFVPKVLVALLILAFGAYFARFVGNAVSAYFKNVHMQDADLLGNLARYAILAFVVLIALDQVNVGGDIVRQTFLILLAGVVFALALAFGLGGREWAAELLDRWWPRKKRPKMGSDQHFPER